MMAPQRSWGSQLQNFKARGGKKRAGTDIATPSQKKQKTGPNPRPTLAPELDELNQFVETVATEEEAKNPDTSFVIVVFQQDTAYIATWSSWRGGANRGNVDQTWKQDRESISLRSLVAVDVWAIKPRLSRWFSDRNKGQLS